MITNREEYGRIEHYKLHDYMAIPSEIHVYSLGIEYMRNWFLEKFPEDTFKTVYINGKHIFDDYRRFNRTQLTKLEKPAVAIIPSVEYDFNRDNIDLELGGRDVITHRGSLYNDALLQDYGNNIFLGCKLKQVQMNFTFRIRLSSRAEQIDMYNFMKLAYRVGATQHQDVSYDYHIPKEIMLNIAESAGFEVEKDESRQEFKVKNIVDFLKYLNSHSIYPILYKMRTINGNSEFFIRLPKLYTHISNLDNLSVDDGDRVNQIDNNFHIEMNSILKIPAPHYYYYYSKDEVNLKYKLKQEYAGLYEFRDIISPDKNEDGWPQYLCTEYIDDNREIERIHFRELLGNKEFMMVIQRTLDSFVSPKIFIDIKLYNGLKPIPIEVDWENFDIVLKNEKPLRDDLSSITIYADLEYINEQLIVLQSEDKTRFNL